jgi:hypothetical protein
MPSRVFQVVLFTDEVEETARFLVDVVGLADPRWFEVPGENNARAFGWPPVASRRVVLGDGPGMIELVEIPVPLRGTIRPGVAWLGFATPDVEGHAERSRAAGFATGEVLRFSGSGDPATLAEVRVGGLPFEFIRFEPDP